MFSSNTTQVSSGGYEIQRSLRFNGADSANLTRTPSTASNRKTWTWSGWVKRSTISSGQILFNAINGSDVAYLYFNPGDALVFGGALASGSFNTFTTAVYRDPSAWYHIVCVFDTTQAVATDRTQLYVNGQRLTLNNTPGFAQNSDGPVNSTVLHYLGTWSYGGAFFNGYMTEINLIDGQALTPSSFGEFNADTGVWQPKRYAGSYGTNGFYLNFSNNSNTTAATLGADYSGNGNNWTPNNFSVSAGAGNDSLVDVPTNWGVDTGVGGTVRGNYCTLNPLTTTSGTYTQGNLRYTGPSNWRRSNATISRSTGQWYWEVTLGNAPFSPRANGSEFNAFGFGVATSFGSVTPPSVVTDAVVLCDNGWYKNFSGSFTDGGTAFASGDVLSVAVDLDANTFTFRRNNTSLVTGTIGGTAGRDLVPIILSYDGQYGVMDCNFGQRPFAYTAPSGFKALNTQNLPTPTIGATTATQAGKFFNPVLYTGNGTTNNISGVGFETDFVWMKNRTTARNHYLMDRVRGITNKILESNTTTAEQTGTIINSTNSDGYQLSSGDGGSNTNGDSYVSWNWKANGAGVTNTAGSITSTVSANTTSGFSVVTFTATANSGTIGHGLGVAPKFIILKSRNNTSNWVCYHASLGADKYINLDGTGGAITNTATWQNTTPTSTVFSSNGPFVTGWTEVAYCFAEVPGYSRFGSYTGNGSTDGPFVFCGFRPAFVLIKMSSGTSNWWLYDTKRGTFNVVNNPLYPDGSFAESPDAALNLDILSNGFKSRSSNGTVNGSGNTYIFAAFAEAPQKFSLAR
jgi:hypothetical protein